MNDGGTTTGLQQPTRDINIARTASLVSPREVEAALPLDEGAHSAVLAGREAIQRILSGEDARFLVIAGPCSIHDETAALDYARRLKALADELSDRLCVVMRVYFEKPRTTVGWKGLINDPHLDGSFDIDTGLRLARRLLLSIADMGLPVATEFLDPITPQYISDLVSWASIGARTTESQTHRQMASGLSMPVGYKNSTNGNLQVAIDAFRAAQQPHAFVGIDHDGRTVVVHTRGNPWGHLALRGGTGQPNYDAQAVSEAGRALAAAGLPSALVVDCSHANSEKQPERQEIVWNNVLQQRAGGDRSLVGLMLESHLRPGKQKLGDDPSTLEYGVSITDACIGWDKTEELLRTAHRMLGEG